MARSLVVRTPMFSPLSEAMDRLFNDAWVSPQSRDWATVWGVGSRLPVNIYADAEGYTFVAVVPGVKAEELNIEAEGNVVKFSGEIIAPAISADEKVRTLRNEIAYGKSSKLVLFIIARR